MCLIKLAVSYAFETLHRLYIAFNMYVWDKEEEIGNT